MHSWYWGHALLKMGQRFWNCELSLSQSNSAFSYVANLCFNLSNRHPLLEFHEYNLSHTQRVQFLDVLNTCIQIDGPPHIKAWSKFYNGASLILIKYIFYHVFDHWFFQLFFLLLDSIKFTGGSSVGGLMCKVEINVTCTDSFSFISVIFPLISSLRFYTKLSVNFVSKSSIFSAKLT